ncbi:Fanconi anemia group C protein isoform 2-T2 [Spinachia spinachia]
MSEPQPLLQLPQTAEAVPSIQEMRFWLDKVVCWGQAEGPDTHKETSLHLSRLKDFLQQLLRLINNMEVLCQLATEEDDAPAQTLMKKINIPPKDYDLKVLRKMVALLQETIGKSCSSFGDINQRCSCDNMLATSKACVPLVTCPEAAPLIGALLQQPVTCVRAALSEHFLHAVSSAYSSRCLSLEEQAVVALWYHNLSSLEEAVLRLLECALTYGGPIPQKQVEQSLLPRACAQHCSIFLVVNDIFRSILKQAEGTECVKYFVRAFTSCFLREVALQHQHLHQTSVSLKAMFPQSPQSLLLPLLTRPTEMPRQAWRHHLMWLSGSLQRLAEEEEDGDGDDNSSTGSGRFHKVFEGWFLLVQCSHWVQVAVQLLVTSEPKDCAPLLWLLTFYHHPTNRGHHRALHLVRGQEAWDHLHYLFLARPFPIDRLQSLVTLLSPQPQPPSLSPSVTLDLLVNFAVFHHSPSASTEIVQMVVDRCGLLDGAEWLLRSLEIRMNEDNCLSSDTERVHLRIQAFQNTLTHMHVASGPAKK